MASRKFTDLVPELMDKAILFNLMCAEAGIDILVTCTARTVKEQLALFAQGRYPLAEVNILRKVAGLPSITLKENAQKVTWTLNSKHIVDLDDGNPGNDKARAFDVAVLRGNKPAWDIKVDTNHSAGPDYDEIGRIGESIGLIWGGRFKTPDRPHFEI